jgi:hypothetical protein
MVAALLSTGQTQVIPQDVNQRAGGVDIEEDGFAVQNER